MSAATLNKGGGDVNLRNERSEADEIRVHKQYRACFPSSEPIAFLNEQEGRRNAKVRAGGGAGCTHLFPLYRRGYRATSKVDNLTRAKYGSKVY